MTPMLCVFAGQPSWRHLLFFTLRSDRRKTDCCYSRSKKLEEDGCGWLIWWVHYNLIHLNSTCIKTTTDLTVLNTDACCKCYEWFFKHTWNCEHLDPQWVSWNFKCYFSHVKFHMENLTCEISHVSFHMWHFTCEKSHMTHSCNFC